MFHLWVAFLGGDGQLDLQAVKDRGEGAQVGHQAAHFYEVSIKVSSLFINFVKNFNA